MNDAAKEHRLAGVILAGGSARRMGGMSKGMLRAGGGLSVIERLIVHMIRAGIEEIVISANHGRPYTHLGCPVVPDKRTDAGPLAGVEAALAHFAGRYDAVLCLPCDLPALSSREMTLLMAAFGAGDRPVVFAETSGPMLHPLCAVMRTELLESISAALDKGVTGVGALWQRLGGSAVHFDDPGVFTNLNSPDDVDAWLGGHGGFLRLSDTKGRKVGAPDG